LKAGTHAAEVSQNGAADATDRVTRKGRRTKAAPEPHTERAPLSVRWTRQNGTSVCALATGTGNLARPAAALEASCEHDWRDGWHLPIGGMVGARGLVSHQRRDGLQDPDCR